MAQLYYRDVDVTDTSGSSLSNYQTRVIFGSGDHIFSHANSDGSDIRFRDSDDNLLDHWIEKYDATNESAIIWVKVPSIPAGGTSRVRCYYGDGDNLVASDPNATFIIYDDFNRSSLGSNYTRYSTDSSGVIGITSNNELRVTLNNHGYSSGQTKRATWTASQHSAPYTIDSRWKNTRASTSEAQDHNGFFYFLCTGTGGDSHLYWQIRDPDADDLYRWGNTITGNQNQLSAGIHVENYVTSTTKVASNNLYQETTAGGTTITNDWSDDISGYGTEYPWAMRSYAGYHGHADMYCDYWRMREYASSEPSLSISSAETPPGSIIEMASAGVLDTNSGILNTR